MTVDERAWTALDVPYAIHDPERIPKERYYDPEFFELEKKMFWPRVWQMACRLDEIPNPGDFAEYKIFEQSVIVVRTDGMQVKAFHNACRHRGVKLVEGHGTCRSGFVCSFHGWCYGLDGANTFVYQPALFSDHNLDPDELGLIPVRCELWGGCAFINLDNGAPPLRDSIEPFASVHDFGKVEALRTEHWWACRLPVNWKLAMEAFMEGYHVMETHPQLNPPGTKKALQDAYNGMKADGTKLDIYQARTAKAADNRQMVDTYIHYMRELSVGMGGMVHANDVRIAEGLRDVELPESPDQARAEWRRQLNDGIVRWYQAAGCDVPDLNEIDRLAKYSRFAFPNYFLLPQYSAAASYRVRPLGPEETLFEVWSLARFPSGRQPPRPTPPEVWAPDDSRWPPITAQDFTNLPKQQAGLHADGFRYMRLSDKREGMISNYQRILDGYLAGRSSHDMLASVQKTNTVIDVPILELEF